MIREIIGWRARERERERERDKERNSAKNYKNIESRSRLIRYLC